LRKKIFEFFPAKAGYAIHLILGLSFKHYGELESGIIKRRKVL